MPWVAWLAAIVVAVFAIADAWEAMRDGFTREAFGEALWRLLSVVFAVSGALILSYRPRNVVGWLLFGPAVATTVVDVIVSRYDGFVTPPEVVGPGLVAAMVVDNVSWMLVFFPLFHLLQVFPTGRVLTARWRPLVWFEALMVVVLTGLVAFNERIGPLEGGEWTITNPIGFIGAGVFESSYFLVAWTTGLVVVVLGGAASAVTRYRRSRGPERDQIKALLFAFSQFTFVYVITAFANEAWVTSGAVWDLIFLLSVVTIPVAVAVAVIRRGLFDIDVVIRKTLIYGVLTGLLIAIYAGSVFLVRNLLGDTLGESSLAVAASTLLVAALFSPLRSRVQSVINRRLFRRRYDADQVIGGFSQALRNFTDVAGISAELQGVVVYTLQPAAFGLWIRPTDNSHRDPV
ncbi:MAG TPA: hypothetical protein VLB85_04855 [Acidimicrobiia bacterium]|nr:hypothetical protein [Acidimicrobiia bacterium]